MSEEAFNPVIKSERLEDKIALQAQENGMGSKPRPYVVFDKEKALNLLIEYPKNVAHICRTMGIHRNTWEYHIRTDPDFAAAVQEIEEAHCDDLEATMLELGKQKSSFNFNDRIAYLRAHRPNLYNPAKVVKVEGYKLGDGEKAKRLGVVETVIDAEIVKTYMDRQEQIKHRQQQRLESGKDGAEGQGTGGTK